MGGGVVATKPELGVVRLVFGRAGVAKLAPVVVARASGHGTTYR